MPFDVIKTSYVRIEVHCSTRDVLPQTELTGGLRQLCSARFIRGGWR